MEDGSSLHFGTHTIPTWKEIVSFSLLGKYTRLRLRDGSHLSLNLNGPTSHSPTECNLN